MAIFNPEETEQASAGYYVVYLFPSNSNRVILGLAQSYQEAEAQYGKEYAAALTKQAELMRMKIPEYSDYFDSGNVDLHTWGKLTYRFGHVYPRVYNLHALPSESKLVEDLSHLLHAYEALFYRDGRDSDNIQVEESESIGEIISFEERHKKESMFE